MNTTTAPRTRLDAAALLAGTTPGPWRWNNYRDEYGKNLGAYLETTARPIPCNDPVIFALRDDWKGELSPEREAAKRLIAAAPDLAARVLALEAASRKLVDRVFMVGRGVAESVELIGLAHELRDLLDSQP